MSGNYSRLLCPVCFETLSPRSFEEHVASLHLPTKCLQLAHCLGRKCSKRDIFSACFLTDHYLRQEPPSEKNNFNGCHLIFPTNRKCAHRLNCQKEYDNILNCSILEIGPVNRQGESADPSRQQRIDSARRGKFAHLKGRKPARACFVEEHYNGEGADDNGYSMMGRSPGYTGGGRSPGYSGGGGRSPGYGGGRSPGYGGDNRSPGPGYGGRSPGPGNGRSPGPGCGGGRSPGYGGRSPGPCYGEPGFRSGRSPGYDDPDRSRNGSAVRGRSHVSGAGGGSTSGADKQAQPPAKEHKHPMPGQVNPDSLAYNTKEVIIPTSAPAPISFRPAEAEIRVLGKVKQEVVDEEEQASTAPFNAQPPPEASRKRPAPTDPTPQSPMQRPRHDPPSARPVSRQDSSSSSNISRNDMSRARNDVKEPTSSMHRPQDSSSNIHRGRQDAPPSASAHRPQAPPNTPSVIPAPSRGAPPPAAATPTRQSARLAERAEAAGRSPGPVSQPPPATYTPPNGHQAPHNGFNGFNNGPPHSVPPPPPVAMNGQPLFPGPPQSNMYAPEGFPHVGNNAGYAGYGGHMQYQNGPHSGYGQPMHQPGHNQHHSGNQSYSGYGNDQSQSHSRNGGSSRFDTRQSSSYHRDQRGRNNSPQRSDHRNSSSSYRDQRGRHSPPRSDRWQSSSNDHNRDGRRWDNGQSSSGGSNYRDQRRRSPPRSANDATKKPDFDMLLARMSSQRVLVYGGKGALGSALVESFKSRGYWVLSVGDNEKADAFISVPKDCSTVVDQEKHVLSEVARKLSDGCKLDAILCVAGGWAGGNAANEAMVQNADAMVRQSVWPSLIAARLAALHLAPNGLLQFTGAAAALSGTPGMVGYGLAKGAVHQLTASLAAEKSGLPSGATVLALLPSTLDTPMNRKWMPKADHSSWTPLPWVGDLLHSFIATPSTRPVSGTLLKLETKAGESTAVPSKI